MSDALNAIVENVLVWQTPVWLPLIETEIMCKHYIDVIMTTVASQITSLTIVYSIVYSGADQRNIKAPRN